MNRMRSLVLVMIAAVCGGCATAPPPCPTTSVPMEQLVAEYNANASLVPRVWAKADIVANIKGFPVSPATATLMMWKNTTNPLGPNDFVLLGREAGGVEVFRVGSSTEDRVYYFWAGVGNEAQVFWGREEYAGAPCATAMPIDPYQLIALLGVVELPTDDTKLPAIAMTLKPGSGGGLFGKSEPCAYVLTYIDRVPVSNRILFKREMYFTWADNAARQLYRVDFIAPDGRRMYTARLSNWQPIAGIEDGHTATMPTQIDLSPVPWPGHQTTVQSVRITLSNLTAEKKGSPKNFTFLPHVPQGVRPDRFIQVDRECGAGGGSQ